MHAPLIVQNPRLAALVDHKLLSACRSASRVLPSPESGLFVFRQTDIRPADRRWRQHGLQRISLRMAVGKGAFVGRRRSVKYGRIDSQTMLSSQPLGVRLTEQAFESLTCFFVSGE